ncbi:MAG: hypothetical protein HZB16_09310 [Armatimonadetes bacterium]|nr:hypothetical protein [Armatimonadota bacterium]
MRLRNWLLGAGAAAVAGLLLVPRLTAAETSGLAKGGNAPLLHVDAFNDTDGEYCVTCRAGKMPAVVAFVTADTETSRAGIKAVDEAWRGGQDKHLNGAVVLVGTADSTKSLRDWVAAQKLAVPTAVAAPDYKDIPNWKVNNKVATTVVLIKEHRIVESLADPDHKSVKDGVAALTN